MFPVQYFALKANNQYEIFITENTLRRTNKHTKQRCFGIMRFHWLFDSQTIPKGFLWILCFPRRSQIWDFSPCPHQWHSVIEVPFQYSAALTIHYGVHFETWAEFLLGSILQLTTISWVWNFQSNSTQNLEGKISDGRYQHQCFSKIYRKTWQTHN